MFSLSTLSTIRRWVFLMHCHLLLGPYSTLCPIRRSVIRRSVIRCWVFRRSVIRCSVIHRSVIRRSVGKPYRPVRSLWSHRDWPCSHEGSLGIVKPHPGAVDNQPGFTQRLNLQSWSLVYLSITVCTRGLQAEPREAHQVFIFCSCLPTKKIGKFEV